jgi:hypothetical protein
MKSDGQSYTNPMAFMNQYGILERITCIEEQEGTTVKSRKSTVIREKPGISPLIMGRILLSCAVFLRLSDMSENLPEYMERVTELEMDEVQSEVYQEFERILKIALEEAMDKGDYSLLGSYLNALLSYPDRMHEGVSVIHPHSKELIAYGPVVEGIKPKERELLDIIHNEVSQNRRVLVYIQNSGTTDISPHLSNLIA